MKWSIIVLWVLGISTFHFYAPFMFTHQGATWTDPSMKSLSGVPFPYDAKSMPACPPNLVGTWVEGTLNVSYATEGTPQRVMHTFDVSVSMNDPFVLRRIGGIFTRIAHGGFVVRKRRNRHIHNAG